MNCSTSARLLHFAAGGDLSSRRAAALAGHVAACDSCRTLQRELARTLQVVREFPSTSSLSEEERSELKRAVWRAIEREEKRSVRSLWSRRPASWLWASAAAAAAVALLLFAQSRMPASRRPTRADGVAEPGEYGASRRPETRAVPGEAARPDAPRISAPAAPVEVASAAAAGRPAGAGRRSRAAATAGGAVTRIELTTSDRQVRIIWLFRKGAAGSPARPPASRTEEVS